MNHLGWRHWRFFRNTPYLTMWVTWTKHSCQIIGCKTGVSIFNSTLFFSCSAFLKLLPICPHPHPPTSSPGSVKTFRLSIDKSCLLRLFKLNIVKGVTGGIGTVPRLMTQLCQSCDPWNSEPIVVFRCNCCQGNIVFTTVVGTWFKGQ